MKHASHMIGVTLLKLVDIVPECLISMDLKECERHFKRLPIDTLYFANKADIGAYYVYHWTFKDLDNNVINNIFIENTKTNPCIKLIAIDTKHYHTTRGKKDSLQKSLEEKLNKKVHGVSNEFLDNIISSREILLW